MDSDNAWIIAGLLAFLGLIGGITVSVINTNETTTEQRIACIESGGAPVIDGCIPD